jgi:dethiobiotin synthetase
MKLCVINFSGNVGKTTIAAHLLKPRMNEAQVFSVESLNSGIENDGVEDAEIIKGKRFGDLG